MSHSEITSFIWCAADLIRHTFNRSRYPDPILPRRLDRVLAPAKPKVLAVHAWYRGRIDDLGAQLRRASGIAFYDTSRYDFEKLLAEAPNIGSKLRYSIVGFGDPKVPPAPLLISPSTS